MIRFLASTAGRALRVFAGVLLILIGIVIGGAGGLALIVIGFVPLLAGVFDVCLFGPLFGQPLSGAKIRGEKPATT